MAGFPTIFTETSFQKHNAFSRKLFMNQKIAHTILSLLLLFVTIHAQKKQIEVVDYYAKVYLAPNPKSKFIGLAQKGELYQVINITDYWYRIKFNAAMGWVIRSQFKDYDPNTQTVQQNTIPFADTQTTDTATPLLHAESIADSQNFDTKIQGSTNISQDTLKRVIPPQIITAQPQKALQPRTEQKPAKSRIRNWFTQQNVFSSPPADQQMDEPELEYFQVTYAPARVLMYLSPESPILGMAKKGALLPLVGKGDSWCKVSYRDTVGWIEVKNGNVVTAPKSLLAIDIKIVGIVFAAIAILIIILIVILRIFKKKNSESPGNNQSLASKKNVLIIAKKVKHIQHTLTDTNTSLERCFSELGFHFSVAKDLPSVRNLLSQLPPDLVLIDLEFDHSILASIEKIFSQIPGSEKILFIIYNVPDPSAMHPSRIFPKMVFLGLYFSDQDIFKLVTPLILSENAKNVQKSIQSSALEGNIADGNLLEVLQFIEIGRKNGCILIEKEHPLALVYFNNGRIIYAATAKGILGRDAVFAVLNMKEGKFRFIIDRKPKTSNVNLSTLEVLMEWTKAVDEANGH